MEKIIEKQVSIGRLIELAKILKGEDGENPEYNLALVELVGNAAGLDIEDWILVARAMEINKCESTGVGSPMPTPGKARGGEVKETLTVFKGTFFVAFDTEDVEDEDGEQVEEVSREEAITYLEKTVILEMNEAEAEPCGFSSLELHYDTLTPLTQDELIRYYGK